MLSATNISYVNQAKADLITLLTASFSKKINESHISSSDNKNDVFRHTLNDVNKSLSEDDIIVDGINEFSSSPHDIDKKAYVARLGKGTLNEYSSRLGFNFYVLPKGEYTLVVEFFQPAIDESIVNVVSSSLNIQPMHRSPE